MPKQAGSWENADFLMELSLALFQVASNGGALSAQAKSAVEDYLKAQGHDQSWESVRLLLDALLSDSHTHLALFLPIFTLFASCGCLFGACFLQEAVNSAAASATAPLSPANPGFPAPFDPFIFPCRHPRALWLFFFPRKPLSPLRSSPLLLFASTLLDPDVAVVMARTQMKWDASAHEAMLICIVKHCDLNANNMAKVLDEMKNRGYEFTENAFRQVLCHPQYPVVFALHCSTVLYMTPLPSKLTTALLSSQHIQKLRKTRDTSALDGSAASGDGSKASTPRKATPRKTPASGRKRKGAVDDDADDLGRDLKVEDEEGATTTPSKRIKSEPASEIRDWRKAAFLLGES
ncbi:hypothetical protein CCM_04555 [Cordyceps militaris CM01]|uniref:Uncharacterized protein n=1 Tax=Cordyceps militaris (strain CM01) TaxID=983644 RepID=G3JFU9_CORMM|nr:uncharacterized protein CCM_04555 [Cordyceps militaris CM01]EGX93183.1 hypothetical protein CCM_04555 [Cordyceps militaris CM01]